MQLTERITKVAPSPTLSLDAKAKALKASGADIVSFGAGEPDFNTPDHIKAAGIKAVEDNFTRYTPAGGTLELKEAVAEKFKRDNDLDYSPDQIVINCGGKHTLYNLAQVLWGPGDEVVIPAPYWVSYPPIVTLAGAAPVIVNTSEANDFKLTADELAAAVTPRTRALILNSPSNPTGAYYSRDELAALADVALREELTVVSDDIYEKILFDGLTFHNMANISAELKEQTVIAHGLAKTFAMTGWRIGFMAGPREVAGAVTKLQSQSTSNPCSIAQKAGLAALNGPEGSVDEMRQAFQDRRNFIVEELNNMDGVKCFRPGGAFYVFPNVAAHYGKTYGERVIDGSTALCDYLLEECGLAAVPGGAFGEDACLRLSYAIGLDEIKEGLRRLSDGLSALG